MRGLSALVATVLLAAACAQGTITYSLSEAPTPNMPGWSTWTLTLHTDTGMYLVGFTTELYSTSLNQVNPVGASTIFADNNFAFPLVGADPAQDTQFPYLAQAGPGQQVGSGPDSAESGTYIRGSFALMGGANSPLAATSLALVQFVVPDGNSVWGGGTVIEYDPATNTQSGTYNWQIPEPATLVLLAVGAVICSSRLRRRT